MRCVLLVAGGAPSGPSALPIPTHPYPPTLFTLPPHPSPGARRAGRRSEHPLHPPNPLSHTPLQVRAALADDLNTPAAVAALSAPLKALNDLLHTKKGRKAQGRAQALACYHAALAASLQLLGLPGGAGAAAGEVLPQLRALALVRWVGVCVGGGL